MSKFVDTGRRKAFIESFGPNYHKYHAASVESLSSKVLLLMIHDGASAVLCIRIFDLLNESDNTEPDGEDFLAWLENLILMTPPALQSIARQTRDAAMDEIARRNKEESPGGGQEIIIHRDDSLPLAFLEKALGCSKSIGLIQVPRYFQGSLMGGGTGKGTAWVCGKGLILTNHHVITARGATESAPSKDDFALQAKLAKVWFGYYDGDAPAGPPLEGWELVYADKDLDYALLKHPQAASLPAPLTIATGSPDTREAFCVNIVQHPLGMAKRIAIRNNLSNRIDGDVLYYYTDTQQGASGSPVCNDLWEVVALHRGFAFQGKGIYFQGKETAYSNQGVLMGAILRDLGNRGFNIP